MKNYTDGINKRAIGSFCLFCLLMLALVGRLCSIVLSDGLQQTAQTQSSYTLTVADERGLIYDCHMEPLVGTQERWLTAVFPTPRNQQKVLDAVSPDRRSAVAELLEKGAGAVREFRFVQGDAASLGMVCGGDVTLHFQFLPGGDRHAVAVLRDVLEAHIASGADMTCVCTSHPGESGDTYFTLDDTGRIVDTAYDVRTPAGYQSLNIFLLSRDLLLELVEECMAHDRYSFRRNVLQEKGKLLRFNGYVWDGFAARINTIQAYYQRSMELLRPEIRAELFCAQRPVYAKENDAASTYIDPSGECINSLISDGCDIQGSIRNCILFRGVRVEKGAHVENSVLFKNTVVKAGANVRCVIADKNVEFGPDVAMAGHPQYPLVVEKNTKL